MKKILTTLTILLSALSSNAQERFLVGGASSNSIAIINKSTEQVEWQHTGFANECTGCNSLVYVDGGDVLYAHKNGAYMITSQKEILWEIEIKEGEELQCVSEIKGGYMVGIAGSPMRILELNKDGKITKEISYETGVANKHRQFRQIAKSKKGSYIIPVSDLKKMVEIDSKGRVKREVVLENSSLYVLINDAGDLIATAGHAGDVYKIDNKSGEVSAVVRGKQLNDGTTIEFGAAITQLRNGNYLLANWVGHKGDQTQPILIEFNDKWEVVWSMKKPDGYTFVAGVDPIY